MLIAMTYNVGQFFAIALGLSISYAIFGFKPITTSDKCSSCPKSSETEAMNLNGTAETWSMIKD